MNKIFCVASTSVLLLCSSMVNAQISKSTEIVKSSNEDVSDLIRILNGRGYSVDNTGDRKALERYIALDTKLSNKHDSIANIFKSIEEYAQYLDESTESDELLNKVRSFMSRGKEIKDAYRIKPKYLNNFSTALLEYNVFLDRYEKAINSFDKETDAKDIEFIVNTFKSKKLKSQQENTVKEEKELDEKQIISTLPSKAAVKAKFRNYTHKTGHVFEMFPVGFTPKSNKPVYDRVFGRKARYREVDENGMNTLVIEFYNSGSILSVTVYKGMDGIYVANYRDHAKKPYEIRSTSADGKFYVMHKRIYDMYANKTIETTRYQYVPLDYEYK